MAPTKGKSKIPLVFQTQIKEIKRYSENVDNVIESDNIQRVFALKCNILKCLERLEDNYYEFSVLEEFVEDVEYENFTNSKDLADLALEKIESYLTSINSKLQFEENKSEVNAYSNINLPKYYLPQFAGDFNSWLSFKSIFSSSIDSNESLTDIQKLQYLQTAVTSDASRLIKGFAITHENYKQAWETLLNRNHNVSSCKFTTSCRACKQRHHTVLHQFQSSPREIPVSNSNQNLAATSDQNVVQPLATSQEQFCLAGQMNYSNSILLSTAIVRVKNSQGHQDIFAVNALVVKELTCNLPNFIVSKFDWPHINGLQLADPLFYISRPVDMILGADVFFDLILYGKISGTKNQPSALNSKLGWLLSGKVSTACQSEKKVMSLINCHALLDLQNQIAKFWEVESIPNASNLSEEDQRVEKFYLDHTRRNRDGRYVVSLPFKNDNALGDSKVQAKRRFFSLEKRLQANPELRDRYVKFMQDYEHLGHMQLVPNSELSKPSSKCFYLPHFGVVREQSETTKLRVVFDASAKTDSNLSLNDILHTGPKLQNELFNILLKFRCHRIALTGDIEKMFRQILVNEDDVEFQRIFWREIPEEPTIQQLAEEEIKKFPEASKVALEDFYVDDLITGTNSKEDAKKLVSQVIELMKKGGFPIRKWASNESSVLESLPTELRSSSGSLHIEEVHLMEILGIIWNSKEDTFRINISPPNEVRPTKRQLLSTIAKIYDPLGFLSPTTIQLKILMQDIWKENISWDDPVTDCIFESWTQFKNQMKHLAEIQIPRYLAEDVTAKRVLLIGFCDASQRRKSPCFNDNI
ncbi:DUF1758 domain-containing protein [Trichonephila clavipes]|nr:DUF1758 domain-containing protein [Trichonephila clavipes]